MSKRLRRHRVRRAASSIPRAPSPLKRASLADRSTAASSPPSGVGSVAGAGRPSPNAPEPAPLVEAALVDEPELLDDPARGPVVGADADVDIAEPGNGRGVPDHAGERRGVHSAAAEPGVRVEAVHDGGAPGQGPRLVDLVHEGVLRAVDEPAVVREHAVLDARVAVLAVFEPLRRALEKSVRGRLPPLA